MTTAVRFDSLSSLVPEKTHVAPDGEAALWSVAWNSFKRGFTLTYFARAGNQHILSPCITEEFWVSDISAVCSNGRSQARL